MYALAGSALPQPRAPIGAMVAETAPSAAGALGIGPRPWLWRGRATAFSPIVHPWKAIVSASGSAAELVDEAADFVEVAGAPAVVDP